MEWYSSLKKKKIPALTAEPSSTYPSTSLPPFTEKLLEWYLFAFFTFLLTWFLESSHIRLLHLTLHWNYFYQEHWGLPHCLLHWASPSAPLLSLSAEFHSAGFFLLLETLHPSGFSSFIRLLSIHYRLLFQIILLFLTSTYWNAPELSPWTSFPFWIFIS